MICCFFEPNSMITKGHNEHKMNCEYLFIYIYIRNAWGANFKHKLLDASNENQSSLSNRYQC